MVVVYVDEGLKVSDFDAVTGNALESRVELDGFLRVLCKQLLNSLIVEQLSL